jgi:hypothetical protein
VKAFFATHLKYAVVSALVSLAFVSQASAVLRPLFPIKPAAPTNDELIIIGDELELRSAKKRLIHEEGQVRPRSERLAGYGLSTPAVPCVGLLINPRAEDAA